MIEYSKRWVMAHKKEQPRELTKEEKVAEILKRANVSYDFKKAQANIALNTRCKRCGKTLSSLERVVFENKCRDCMVEENRKSRDKFVRKYIIIAFLFIVALVFGGYCANAGTKEWRIVGVVVSAIFTGVSLGYVFYTNMDKMMPGAQPKVQVWLVFGLALGIAAIIAFLTYFSKSWILYVVLMLLVLIYVAYLAVKEFNSLKEKDNLLGVYDRKSRDHEFIDSITESIKERTLQDENDRVNAISVENTDFVSPVPPETDDKIVKEEIVEVSDEKTETEEDISVSVKTTEQAEIKDDDNLSSAAEKSDDSGDFSI